MMHVGEDDEYSEGVQYSFVFNEKTMKSNLFRFDICRDKKLMTA